MPVPFSASSKASPCRPGLNGSRCRRPNCGRKDNPDKSFGRAPTRSFNGIYSPANAEPIQSNENHKMKNPKLLLFILTGQLLASGLAAQTADDLVSAGRACLVAHNLTGAYSNFNAAVTLSPTNEAANALAAATRILVLPQQPAGSNFLNTLKFSTGGRDIYNWTSTFPHDINGHTVLPTNNTSMMVAFYRTKIGRAHV